MISAVPRWRITPTRLSLWKGANVKTEFVPSLRRRLAMLLIAALGLAAAQSAPSTSPIYQWTTVAGRASIGLEDGPSAAARFNNPTGLAFDAVGYFYVADTGNLAIRKLSPGGDVSTLAGSPGEPGSADGVGEAARFNSPEGVAVDAVENVYVADTGNYTIRMVTASGGGATLAGQAGKQGSTDGNAATALFNSPRKIAADGAGNVYVLDQQFDFPYQCVIRRISAGIVQTILTSGPVTLTSPGYSGPVTVFGSGLAVDASQQIYFDGAVGQTQYGFRSSAILKVDTNGAVSVVSTLPQLPWGENSGLLAIDPAGNVLATERAGRSDAHWRSRVAGGQRRWPRERRALCGAHGHRRGRRRQSLCGRRWIPQPDDSQRPARRSAHHHGPTAECDRRDREQRTVFGHRHRRSFTDLPVVPQRRTHQRRHGQLD